MSGRTGFLEESPGVKSSTRLTIAWMCVLATGVVAVLCVYVLRPEPKPEVIAAMGAVLATLVVKAIVAIRNRNGDADAKDGAA